MAYQPTVALSPEAREKINAAMKARGERGRDYFSTRGIRVVGADVVEEAARLAAHPASLPDNLAALSRAAAKNSHDDDLDLALNLFMSRDERRLAADKAAFDAFDDFESLLSKAERSANAANVLRRHPLTPKRESEQTPGAPEPVVADDPRPVRASESLAEVDPSDGALSRIDKFVEAATRRADPKQRLKDPAKFAPSANYEVEEHGAGIGYAYGAQASANAANVLRGVPNTFRSVLGVGSRIGELSGSVGWVTPPLLPFKVAQPLMRAYERFVGKQHYTTYTGARIPEFGALDALSGKVSADTFVDALPGALSETAVGAYIGSKAYNIGSKALGPLAGKIERAAGAKARALGGKIYAPPRTAAPLPGELPLGHYTPPRGLARWFYRRPAFQRSVPHTTATRRFGDLYQPELLSPKASLVKQAPPKASLVKQALRKASPAGNAKFEKAAASFKPNPRAELGKDVLERLNEMRAKGLIK